MSCPNFACAICGICGKPRSSGKPKKVPENPKLPPLKRSYAKGRLALADSMIIYVLGTMANGPQQVPQLDVYSGLNGYHIRSIPADRRWHNPVSVGAGEGYLAVVDRYNDHDIIRVTDQYAGAGAAGFDEDGFPLADVDWGGLDDAYQIPLPTGSQCLGVSILHSGILVGSIQDSSGVASYVQHDLKTDMFKGIVTASHPGGLGNYGNFVGQPAPKETDVNADVFQFFMGIQGSDNNGVYLMELVRSKVVSALFLPTDLAILGIGYAKNTLSIVTGEDNVAQRILRVNLPNKPSYLMTGLSPAHTPPTPQEYTVEVYPAVRNPQNDGAVTEATIKEYWSFATAMNAHRDNTYTDLDVPASLKGVLRKIEPKSNTELSDGRTPIEGSVAPKAYGGASVPTSEISVPEALKLRTITSNHGVIAELFNRVNESGAPDTTQPVFRLIDGHTYEFILDGGFTFGGTDPDTGIASGTTNGIVGTSIAVDKSYVPGKLKEIDLKVALIDTDTNLYIYRFPKLLTGAESEGLPYTVYAGQYAALKPYAALTEVDDLENENAQLRARIAQEQGDAESHQAKIDANQERIDMLQGALGVEDGATVQSTPLTATMDAIATKIDGISRPSRKAVRDLENEAENGDTYVVPEFNNQEDCDRYWALFQRRVKGSRSADVQPVVKSWTKREPVEIGAMGSAYYPEYRSGTQANPVVVDYDSDTLCAKVSRETGDPVFECVGLGGFFVPNWPMEMTTTHAKWRGQIADIKDTNEKFQDAVDKEEAKPEESQNAELIKLLEQRIEANEARIEELRERINEEDDENLVEVDRSLLKRKFSDVAASKAQQLSFTDADDFEYDQEDMADHGSVGSWGTTYVAEEALGDRACAITPDIRSWIAIDYRFDYWGIYVDGKANWVHPATRSNGLGVGVGDMPGSDAPYAEAFNIVPGSIYETGYRSFYDQGGAEGFWKISILIDGEPISKLKEDGELAQAMYWDIFWRAPEDLRDRLLATFTGHGHGVVNPGKGKKGSMVFYSSRKIKTVEIKAELWNYAFEVYRYGYRTLQFDDSRGMNPACPKTDPGYWAGDNCEASACGNVICFSAIVGAKNHLFSGDPTADMTEVLVWEGYASYSFKEDPYAAQGVLMGRFFDCYVDFDLGATLPSYDIDIRG